MNKIFYISIVILLSGCTTVTSVSAIQKSGYVKCNTSTIKSPIYSGTRCALNNAGRPGDLGSGIDMLFCIPADTIILPYTLLLHASQP